MKITLYIQPGASKTEISGTHNGMVKLRIAAPPVEGAANKAVLEFVTKTLGLPKSAAGIVSGEKSRVKTVEFDENRMKEPSKAALFEPE